MKLKRVARYMLSWKAVEYQFGYMEEPEAVSVFTDSDWAGCRVIAKSTSGGVIMIGSHVFQ